MTANDIGFWVATIAAVIGAIYAGLAYHRPMGPQMADQAIASRPRRFWLPLVLAIIAWAAVGFDYADRHWFHPPSPRRPFISWSLQTPYFIATIDTVSFADQSDKFKMLLLARGEFADVDPMTDRNVAVGDTYTITGSGFFVIAVNAYGKIKVHPTGITSVRLYVILLPKNILVSQIHCLSDVGALDGKILDTVSIGVPMVSGQPATKT